MLYPLSYEGGGERCILGKGVGRGQGWEGEEWEWRSGGVGVGGTGWVEGPGAVGGLVMEGVAGGGSVPAGKFGFAGRCEEAVADLEGGHCGSNEAQAEQVQAGQDEGGVGIIKLKEGSEGEQVQLDMRFAKLTGEVSRPAGWFTPRNRSRRSGPSATAAMSLQDAIHTFQALNE